MSGRLAATTEITTAILSNNLPQEDQDAITKNPRNYIYSSYSLDMGDNVDLIVAKNDDNTVNLILPYYSNMDKANSEPIDEETLEAVAGGEVIIAVVIASAVGIGTVASVGINAIDKYQKGQNFDGSPK